MTGIPWPERDPLDRPRTRVAALERLGRLPSRDLSAHFVAALATRPG